MCGYFSPRLCVCVFPSPWSSSLYQWCLRTTETRALAQSIASIAPPTTILLPFPGRSATRATAAPLTLTTSELVSVRGMHGTDHASITTTGRRGGATSGRCLRRRTCPLLLHYRDGRDGRDAWVGAQHSPRSSSLKAFSAGHLETVNNNNNNNNVNNKQREQTAMK